MALSGYIKIGTIPGDSKRDGHEDEIIADSVSFGAARGVSVSGNKRESGLPSISSIQVTKAMDKATPYLLQSCLKGTNLGEVIFTMRKSAGDAHIDYLTITTTNTLVESISTMGAEGSSNFNDSVLFNFEEITLKYIDQDDELNAGEEHEFKYNILKAV